MFKYFFLFSCAGISSIIFTNFFSKICLKQNKLKTNNVPLAGGIAISLAFIFSLCIGFGLFNLLTSKILAIALACLLMFFFGLLDDLRELTVAEKLIAQSLCVAILIYSGVRTEIMFLGFWGNVTLTFLAILAMTNAFNLLDIMDGLAAGISLIVSIAFLLLGFMNKDLTVQFLSLILLGLSAGFLIFNLPPAKVYLGNSGSHFLGMLIAVIALIAHYATSANSFALFSPVMILGFPILDTMLLIIFRIMKGKNPFKKSKDHLALKIGSLGFLPIQTILIMYLICAMFASCGVVLTRINNSAAVYIVGVIFLLSTGIFLKLVKVARDE